MTFPRKKWKKGNNWYFLKGGSQQRRGGGRKGRVSTGKRNVLGGEVIVSFPTLLKQRYRGEGGKTEEIICNFPYETKEGS